MLSGMLHVDARLCSILITSWPFWYLGYPGFHASRPWTPWRPPWRRRRPSLRLRCRRVFQEISIKKWRKTSTLPSTSTFVGKKKRQHQNHQNQNWCLIWYFSQIFLGFATTRPEWLAGGSGSSETQDVARCQVQGQWSKGGGTLVGEALPVMAGFSTRNGLMMTDD